MDIIDALNSKADLLYGDGIENNAINEAEKKLGLKFAQEYRKYLSVMTIAAYGGHELTGLTKLKRTNVVEVTKKKRTEYLGIPDDWYVIEDTNIDLIVIWQQFDGKIYQTVGKNSPILIAESLLEYVLRY